MSASVGWSFAGTSIDSIRWDSPPTLKRGMTTSVVLQFYGSGSETRYESVRDYLDYAGTTRHGIQADGTPWFQENLPSSASVNQQVVSFEPDAGVPKLQGFWGAIDAGTDLSGKPGGLAIEIEFTVLALLHEYGSYTAIKNDIGGGADIL